MAKRFTIGLDFGTSSMRAAVVDVETGEVAGVGVAPYSQGVEGVVTEAGNALLARQEPVDYMEALEVGALEALRNASRNGIDGDQVAGIGVAATGSTPLPVDITGMPLSYDPRFKGNPAAMAWLWKDHTAHAEAEEITSLAAEIRPNFLEKCGGTYSSEWFWAKILHCVRKFPEVAQAATTWVEIADWIPAMLCGTQAPAYLVRGLCTAGHKGLFHDSWGGYPDAEFLHKLDPRLVYMRQSLPRNLRTVARPAGHLNADWAGRLGLSAGIPVAVGALDAHLGAVGAGVAPGTLVKIIGTSACDITVAPLQNELPHIPGLCGVVPESVLPGHHGLEAGQAAVGDVYNWFVNHLRPGNESWDSLMAKAAAMRPGGSGLMALDWFNGNRTVLADPRLTGLIVGMTPMTSPSEIFRALMESTAFGARTILDRLTQYGIAVDRVVACGGIAVKNPLSMDIMASVLNRPIDIAGSDETCAVGAAMAGAVAAGVHPGFEAAAAKMVVPARRTHQPVAGDVDVYTRLHSEFRKLHDTFGPANAHLGGVMKVLLNEKERASVR